MVPLLNGMDAAPILTAALGASHVVGGLCLIISFLEAPGVIRHTAGSDTQLISFGELVGPCESPRIARLRQVFLAVGVPASVPPDDVRVEGMLWEKFVKIVSFSGSTAVCRAGIGALLEQPRSRQIFLQLQAEGVAVARAHGGGALLGEGDAWAQVSARPVARLPCGVHRRPPRPRPRPPTRPPLEYRRGRLTWRSCPAARPPRCSATWWRGASPNYVRRTPPPGAPWPVPCAQTCA